MKMRYTHLKMPLISEAMTYPSKAKVNLRRQFTGVVDVTITSFQNPEHVMNYIKFMYRKNMEVTFIEPIK